jgi:hypothetical protein
MQLLEGFISNDKPIENKSGMGLLAMGGAKENELEKLEISGEHTNSKVFEKEKEKEKQEKVEPVMM